MRSMLVLSTAAWLAGCEDDGEANPKACEDFVAALQCGDLDAAALGYADDYCDVYAQSDCDMADYWKCMTGSVSCNPDTLELTVDADGACAEKSVCL
jgi:hypothetical protein